MTKTTAGDGFPAAQIVIDDRSLLRLIQRLRKLPNALHRKALVDGTKAAAKILVAPLKSATPVRTGALRAAQTLKRTRHRNKNTIGFKVRAPASFTARIVVDTKTGKAKLKRDKKADKGGAKQGRIRPSQYTHLVEYGTKHSQGTHYAENTMAAHRDQMLTIFAQHIRKALKVLR